MRGLIHLANQVEVRLLLWNCLSASSIVARQNTDLQPNQIDDYGSSLCKTCKNCLMLPLLRLLCHLVVGYLHSRRNLLLENLALRQQLAVLRQRHPQLRFVAAVGAFALISRGTGAMGELREQSGCSSAVFVRSSSETHNRHLHGIRESPR